jgi:hypothetical protein
MVEKIVVALQGGLGNQLFQYAAGLAVVRAFRGAGVSPPPPLLLTAPEENKHSGRDYRGVFYSQAQSYEPKGDEPFVIWYPADSFIAWSPEDLAAAAATASLSDSALYMRGFFQYLPAVAPVLPFVRHEILRKISERRLYVQKRYAIEDPAAVAFVHVRRGDYVELEKEGFWNLGADYYRPALQRIRVAGAKRIFLITDDPAWCSTQPWLAQEGLLLSDEGDELNALALMSMCCGGAVIANSTFSWWGAWLGAAGAPVVYPSLWYQDRRPELFPADWIPQAAQQPEPSDRQACPRVAPAEPKAQQPKITSDVIAQ